MQEFIQQAMGALGTSEPTTKAATGSLLNFLDTNGPKADVNQLLDKLPGARDLMSSASSAGGEGGLMGSLGGAASALGVNVGGAAGLIGTLQQSGLDGANVSKFVSMFLEFAKSKVGQDVVNRIAGTIPGLAA